MATNLDPVWVSMLRDRLDTLAADGDGLPISIKLRVPDCFCRSCCPTAWAQIDRVLPAQRYRTDDFLFEPHETGPEIIIYVALTTAGLSLAAQAINLITAVIKARYEGAKKGDRPAQPMQVIVRSVTINNVYLEKGVTVISDGQSVDSAKLKSEIDRAITELYSDAEKLPKS